MRCGHKANYMTARSRTATHRSSVSERLSLRGATAADMKLSRVWLVLWQSCKVVCGADSSWHPSSSVLRRSYRLYTILFIWVWVHAACSSLLDLFACLLACLLVLCFACFVCCACLVCGDVLTLSKRFTLSSAMLHGPCITEGISNTLIATIWHPVIDIARPEDARPGFGVFGDIAGGTFCSNLIRSTSAASCSATSIYACARRISCPQDATARAT